MGRAYLRAGEFTTRFLWVRVAPRNPLLTLIMAPLMLAMMLAVVLVILLLVSFALLAVVLLWPLWAVRSRRVEKQ